MGESFAKRPIIASHTARRNRYATSPRRLVKRTRLKCCCTAETGGRYTMEKSQFDQIQSSARRHEVRQLQGTTFVSHENEHGSIFRT